jgi:two-component system sensor kinase
VLAVDEETGHDAVVKTTATSLISTGARLRLQHEAGVLARVTGPGLVPLLTVGEDDGLIYLAMPFLTGETLSVRLSRGSLDTAQTLVIASRLIHALEATHSQGVLHRDVKPSNVIVDGDPVGTATLIDFGLARSQQLESWLRDLPVGTARYASPEQAGLVHHEVDERSDLYSLGVLLFECLAGRPPFVGATVGELLRAHLSEAPPELRSLGLDVPTALSQIVERLLRKDPDDRYQSATAVLTDLDELGKRLAAGDPDPAITVGASDRRPTLTEPAFVGRTSDLAILAEEAARAEDGQGGLVLLEAESGGGKSRLLEEFGRRCAQRGMFVLRGQGVDQMAARPFQMLDGVADGVLARMSDEPAYAEHMRATLGEAAPAVRAVLPVLADLDASEGSESLGPEEHGEQRSLQALGLLLDGLGTPERPAVVLLDDCQWADELTVSLFHRWQQHGAARRHVCLVVAFRTEDVDERDALRRTPGRPLQLAPFDGETVRALVESMAGPVPREVLALVQRLCTGSPFMASAVLRGLVESGALVHEDGGWSVERALLADAQSSSEAATFLARRLDLLNGDSLALLCAGAVLGKQFDLEAAAALADQPAGRALAALVPARRRHILWLDPSGASCTFAHDKLRESLLGKLSAERRLQLHRAAAVHLEATKVRSPYELAYHHHAAGDYAAALPYALQAAVEARARHAVALAEQQFRIAERGLEPSDRVTRLTVTQGLGDVLMLRGQYDEAAASYAEALALTTDGQSRAAISLRLGELAFKRGDVVESITHLEGGLRSLRRRVPGSNFAFVVGAVWEVLVQAMHTVLPRRLIQRRSLVGAEATFMAARIYSRLAYSYWFARGKMPTGWAHLREMNILERYPPTLELAQAYSEHAPVATTIPWYSRGIDYVERSYAIRRQFGDVWGQGQSLAFYGVVLYAASRFEDALEKLAQAIRLLERTGDQWEINTARWHMAFAQYRLGRLTEAQETSERCYRDGITIGDHHAAGISLAGWSKATAGQVPADLVVAELARGTDDVHTVAELCMAEAIRLLAAGQPREATAVLRDGQRRIDAAGLHTEYVAPVRAWLVTALRCQAEALGVYAAAARQDMLREAGREARRSHRMAKKYKNNLPHVLRERGLIAALGGNDRRAVRLLRGSAEIAARQHMQAELTNTQSRLTALASLDNGVVATAAVADLTDVSGNVRSSTPTLSLIDRFDGVLRSGRTIASSLTAEAVYRSACTAMIELLRGEDCSMYAVQQMSDGGYQLITDDDSSDSGFRQQLLRRSLASGRPQLRSDDRDDSSDGIGAVDRSALVAPISVRGRPVACLYVSHSQVSELFAADELRLAEFVATVAGAALENAEGFAKVEALTHSLEHRVEERTHELSASNIALRSALDELERVNEQLRAVDELKSDFVAMVSHELKSPLTSILGYCSMMLRRWDTVSEEQKLSFIEIINQQGQRLSRLVHDLLEMSRIESGYLETHLQPVRLRELIELTIGTYHTPIDGITIDVGVDVVVLADPDHLQRVLINLLDNAQKYGAPPVVVSAQRRPTRIELTVADQGPGVPDEFRERLFEKFAQASVGPTRRASGTGLGLSIVRGLARAMGGEVSYVPNTPSGSRFVIDLPVFEG